MQMLRQSAGNAMLTGTWICALSSISGTGSLGRTRKQGSRSVILGGHHVVPYAPGLHPAHRAAVGAG